VADVTITTPGGVASSISAAQTADQSEPDDPFSLNTLEETLTVDGRVLGSTYDAATGSFVLTTPAGRQMTRTFDDVGRPLTRQMGGLEPTSYAYDADGRLAS